MSAGEKPRQSPFISLHGGHTTAGDGSASAREMIAAALQRGLDVFGVSEHFYRPREERFRYPGEPASSQNGRRGWPDLARQVLSEKERLGEDRPTRLLFGAEAEFLPGYEDWTRKELSSWPLDYVVISVHFIEHEGEVFPFDYSAAEWMRAAQVCGGVPQLFRRYYEHVLEAVEWRIGDVLGHLDVIKIHAESSVEDAKVDALIDEILRRCAELDVKLDLNARGLIKPCAEIYPSLKILTRAHERGVGIVTGDDSHKPSDVGLNLDRALRWAARAGYDAIELPARLGGECWPITLS
jgi:histidinol-phosphatase (PHP family)